MWLYKRGPRNSFYQNNFCTSQATAHNVESYVQQRFQFLD